jgi:predicted O-methyltransferase YrrM
VQAPVGAWSWPMKALARPIYRRLPPESRALLDYLFRRRKFYQMHGGALNGQEFRRQLMLDLLARIPFEHIYETGAFFGSSTAFFAAHCDGRVVTIESNPYYHHFTALRQRSQGQVDVVHGDSVTHLERLAADLSETTALSLFYLDAHWYDHLPLRDELSVVFRAWKRAVVVVDDFEVPGDPGYRFDDYGDGKRLCLRYLTPVRFEGMRLFFPTAPSEAETGARRGCVVITGDDEIADVLSGLRSLWMLEETNVDHPNFATA